jgi:hypothetical protein
VPPEDTTRSMGTYHFEYGVADKILAIRFDGWLSDEVLLAFYAAAPRHIESHDVGAGIVDFSGVSGLRVSTDAIDQIAHLPAVFVDTIPRFVIAPSELTFGLARMFEMMSEQKSKGLLVVRSLGEAYAALGVREPAFQRLT